MKKVVVYPCSHVYFDDAFSAIYSALDNGHVDEIWLMTDRDEFPHPLPDNVHTLNVAGQEWFQPGSPNYRNEFSFICLVRVALTKLFPEMDRILSLDLDTIVTDDISELWDLDLTDYYMAGVPEVRLSEEKGYPYVNMGMAMFNLAKIRADHLDDRMIVDINKRRYTWVEQDCINENMQGHVLPLGSEYNTSFCCAPCDRPKILHYAATPGWQENPVVQRYRNRGKQPVVMYLCNGEKICRGSIGCYKNGGQCRHTKDEEYALHKDVSERKEILQAGSNGELYFLEIDDAESILPF